MKLSDAPGALKQPEVLWNFDHRTFGYPCFRNFKPSNTRLLRRAKARALAGVSRAIIAMPGDSTTATASNTLAGGRRRTYPRRVAQLLNRPERPAQEVAVFGYAGLLEANYRLYEDRLNMSSEWTSTSLGMGGAYYNLPNGAGAGTFAFTPGIPFDTIEIWVIAQSGRAVLDVNVDGGASIATINTGAGTFGVRKETLTCDLGEHTIEITRASGGIASILAIIPINSTKPVLDVYNLGISGARSSTFNQTTQGYNPGNSIPLLGADCIIYEIGVNNWGDQTPIETFAAEVQGFIDKNKANSDIILVCSEPQAVSGVALDLQKPYRDATVHLAMVNDLPLIDMREMLEAQEIWASDTGYGAYYDDKHTNEIGAALRASITARAIEMA